MSRSIFAQQGPKACPLEVLIAGQGVGNPALPHNDEGDAVGQPPFFSGPSPVELECLLVQLSREDDDPAIRVRFQGVEYAHGCGTMAPPGEGIADFQQYSLGSDYACAACLQPIRQTECPLMEVVARHG